MEKTSELFTFSIYHLFFRWCFASQTLRIILWCLQNCAKSFAVLKNLWGCKIKIRHTDWWQQAKVVKLWNPSRKSDAMHSYVLFRKQSTLYLLYFSHSLSLSVTIFGTTSFILCKMWTCSMVKPSVPHRANVCVEHIINEIFSCFVLSHQAHTISHLPVWYPSCHVAYIVSIQSNLIVFVNFLSFRFLPSISFLYRFGIVK